MRAVRRPLALLIVALAAACGSGPAPGDGEVPTVWVAIPPQREIVERVAGGAVHVEVLLPPGQSPATYEATPRQLASLEHAATYLSLGVPFETVLLPRLRSSSPGLEIVDLRRGVELVPMDEPHRHSDEAAAGASHGAQPDPHIWLDPVRVAQVAEATRDALCAVEPDGCGAFSSGLLAYRRELSELDTRLDRLLAPCRGHDLLVFHPAYGYLARRYGMRQVALEADGKPPTPRRLADIADRIDVAGQTTLFVQPQFAGAAATAAAQALGVDIVELDPLAPDLVANLDRMANAIARGCGDTGGS